MTINYIGAFFLIVIGLAIIVLNNFDVFKKILSLLDN